jgi:hypothetical protein
MLLTAWFGAWPSGLITLSTLPEVGCVPLMERRGKAPSTRLGVPSGSEHGQDRLRRTTPFWSFAGVVCSSHATKSLVDTQEPIGVALYD